MYAPSRARLNGIFFFTPSEKTSRHSIGSRTSCRSIRSVILQVIKQSGLPLRGRPILFTTRMITDRIGLHSVLLPLLIERRSVTSRYHGSKIFWITTVGSFCNGDGEQQKNNGFRLAKKQLCPCITVFCTFLSRCCATAT